jgi:hypothetical protein
MMGDSNLPLPEGAISSSDYNAYIAVIRDALLVHYDRERVRQGLWKEYTAVDQVNSIKIKADRVVRSLEVLGRTEDDGLKSQIVENIASELHDIINYSVFAVRQL